MRRPPCADRAELRSAYVDGALDESDRERLVQHLNRCLPCRRDVDELRTLRLMLHRARSGTGSAPLNLSERLVSIAATDLGSGSRGRDRDLGWGRRSRRRVRSRSAGLVAGLAVVAVGAVGYAAAPSEPLPAISQPTRDAQAEFTSALGQFPLMGDSVGTVLLAGNDIVSAGARAGTGPSQAVGAPMTADEAYGRLSRASEAAAAVRYTGVQDFAAVSAGRTYAATVALVNVPGEGTSVLVTNTAGRPLVSRFAPDVTASRMADDDLMRLLRANYVLSGQHGATAAGRAADVIDASRDGRLVSRWWVDTGNGMVLWQQNYAADGSVTLSYGFLSLTLDPPPVATDPAATQILTPTITTALSLSSAERLTDEGWACRNRLAGLALVRLRSDRADTPDAIHLVYSDGLNSVSVLEQRGRLDTRGLMATWDPDLHAYVQHGTSDLATWQSGGTVFTVVADGPADTLDQVVDSLPHEKPRHRTTMGRVEAGWAEILAVVKG